MTLLETESVGPMRLLYPPSRVVTDAVMHRPRIKQMQIYKSPHVIMRNGFNVNIQVPITFEFGVSCCA
jgi:hypothetical protein